MCYENVLLLMDVIISSGGWLITEFGEFGFRTLFSIVK